MVRNVSSSLSMQEAHYETNRAFKLTSYVANPCWGSNQVSHSSSVCIKIQSVLKTGYVRRLSFDQTTMISHRGVPSSPVTSSRDLVI